MELGIFKFAETVDSLVDEARLAHEQGFGHFFTPQIFGLDALTALAVVAREVPEIVLGTGVVAVYRQHPMTLAQQALTVSQVGDGRLMLGVGLSHQIVVEGMWGLSFEKPLRHMREYLDGLMPLLNGEAANAEGEAVVTRGGLEIEAPRPQVVLAALGPKMLELAGQVADGTVTWMVGPRTLESHIVPTISASAEAAGRPAPQIVVSLPICVTKEPDAARARAAGEFVMYGQLPSYRAMLDLEGAEGPEHVALIGSAAHVEEQLAELDSAGATLFVANEYGNRAEREATRELLTSKL